MGYPYDDGVNEQEAANEAACYDAAIKSGYTTDQADNCEDGELKCKECPWNATPQYPKEMPYIFYDRIEEDH